MELGFVVGGMASRKADDDFALWLCRGLARHGLAHAEYLEISTATNRLPGPTAMIDT